MQQLTLMLTIDVDGRNAGDLVDDLAIDTDAGMLDQAALDLVRQHLHRLADFRDYRIVRCMVNVQESGA